MATLFQTTYLGLQKAKNAGMRFPFMTGSALLAFVFTLFYNHFYISFSIDRLDWLLLVFESVCGIAIFFSFMVFSEKNRLDKGKRLGLGLLGFCILGLHYYSLPNWAANASIDSTYFLRFFLLHIVFILLASFILFYKEKEGRALWQYNQYLFINFIVSSAYSLVLFIGVSSALYAIENLFDLSLANAIYWDVFVFFLVFVNAIFFSSVLPDDLQSFNEKQEYKNALRVLVQYVLLPIIGLYFIILILYFGKLLVESTLPDGWVCKPILVFSSISILAYLLSFPIKENKSLGLIHFFSKNIFYFILPLLVLYAIAMYTRVLSFGITEWRYVGIILGVWLFLVSLYSIFDSRQSLLFFPLSLFILVVLGAVGPWGMFQLSARSQNQRLCKLLERNDLLENKVFQVSKAVGISDSLQNEISAITKYLFYRERIDLVYPILAEDQKKQIDEIRKGDNKVSAFNKFLAQTFSLKKDKLIAEQKVYGIYCDETSVLDIKGFDHLTQLTDSEQKAIVDSNNNVILEGHMFNLTNQVLTIYNTFDQSEEYPQKNFDSLTFFLLSDDEQAKIYFDNLRFTVQDDSSIQIVSYSAFLLEKN